MCICRYVCVCMYLFAAKVKEAVAAKLGRPEIAKEARLVNNNGNDNINNSDTHKSDSNIK